MTPSLDTGCRVGGVTSDVVDGNVASKAGDVGDNGGMTCRGEVFEGSVEYAGGIKVWEGGVENSCGIDFSRCGVEYLGGIEVLSVERPIT